MENNNEGSSWEGAWNLVYGILLLPVIIFPFWLLCAVIAEVVIQPMLYPY